MDRLNNIKVLEDHGIRFTAVTQRLDTDQQNPASRFSLHVLGAAAEFARSLILVRTQAGRQRYKQDYAAGRVGKTVNSRSGRNLPPHRPKKVFDREAVVEFRQPGHSYRAIAKRLGVGGGDGCVDLTGAFLMLWHQNPGLLRRGTQPEAHGREDSIPTLKIGRFYCSGWSGFSAQYWTNPG